MGLDSGTPGRRPISAIDEGRASVVRLRRGSHGWEPDPAFGQDGLWLAGAAEGEITTVDRMALANAGLIVVGHATKAGADSLFG